MCVTRYMSLSMGRSAGPHIWCGEQRQSGLCPVPRTQSVSVARPLPGRLLGRLRGPDQVEAVGCHGPLTVHASTHAPPPCHGPPEGQLSPCPAQAHIRGLCAEASGCVHREGRVPPGPPVMSVPTPAPGLREQAPALPGRSPAATPALAGRPQLLPHSRPLRALSTRTSPAKVSASGSEATCSRAAPTSTLIRSRAGGAPLEDVLPPVCCSPW